MYITDDYVSFETAKLLKEKGFDADECEVHYDPEDHTQYEITLQMAMKWLREVHNIAIETKWEHLWYAYIKPMTSWPFEKGYEDFQESSKYEYACEAAILYCLENMI